MNAFHRILRRAMTRPGPRRPRRGLTVAVALGFLLAAFAIPASADGAGSPTETNVTNGLGGGEPEIALDPVHHTMVTTFTTTNSVCGIALSTDGGQSWQVSTTFPADP